MGSGCAAVIGFAGSRLVVASRTGDHDDDNDQDDRYATIMAGQKRHVILEDELGNAKFTRRDCRL